MTNSLKADKSVLFRYNDGQISPKLQTIKENLRYSYTNNAAIDSAIQITAALIEEIKRQFDAGEIKEDDKKFKFCYSREEKILMQIAILCNKIRQHEDGTPRQDYNFLRR